jgi:hypothetical protein
LDSSISRNQQAKHSTISQYSNDFDTHIYVFLTKVFDISQKPQQKTTLFEIAFFSYDKIKLCMHTIEENDTFDMGPLIWQYILFLINGHKIEFFNRKLMQSII